MAAATWNRLASYEWGKDSRSVNPDLSVCPPLYALGQCWNTDCWIAVVVV